MKLLYFDDFKLGVLKGDKVVDVTDLVQDLPHTGPHDLINGLIVRFDDYRATLEAAVESRDGVALDSVRIRPPLPKPGNIDCMAVNYMEDGTREAPAPINAFMKSPNSVIGQGDTMVLPDVPATIFEGEAELALIIGKRASNVSEADAMDYIFGYAPFFDVSARGLTRRSQFLPKGQDSFAPCGPWITTADEVADPHDLQVKSWVGGEARQDYNTKAMAHYIPAQIAWVSKFIQLQPGDVIATGTFHTGLGPVNPGDVIEIEIEGLGRTSFNVAGDSPRKDVKWVAGNNLPVKPGLSISEVL